MADKLTMGSLFSGSGGFELGALLSGIIPIFSSEIEPFPIRVTTKRFPWMKHCGDICKINGGEIEPVDVITFGSPCTNMSVAGKRDGLNSGQSALFFEAIRVIKEMRLATNGRSPRFIVFENVVGVYSSSGGNDFREVLSEIVKIKDEGLSVPMPENGRWLSAGEIVGDGFSVAWRTLDAQYWGVAQRRRRCFLVADFNGECAGKVLFESESLSGYTPQSFCAGQRTTANAESGAGKTGVTVLEEHEHQPLVFEPGAVSKLGGHAWQNSTGALRADMGDNQLAVAIENHPADSRVKLDESGTIQTLTGRMGTGGGNVPLVMNERQCAMTIGSKTANALMSSDYKGVQCVFEPRAFTQNQREEVRDLGRCAGTLAADSGIHQQTYVLQGNMIGREDKNGPNGCGINEDVCFTLNTIDNHAVAYDCRNYAVSDVSGTIQAKNNGGQSLNYINPVAQAEPGYIVRRLLPQECALLMGCPSNWCSDLETSDPTDAEIAWWSEVFETHRKIMGTSGKPKSRNQIIKWLQNPHSDSAEYKMWGNGVALPCVRFVMAGIVWAVNTP